MANGLSMKVLLQLQKQQFDKGLAQVKNSLSNLAKSVRNVAGMLVGGLGLASLVGHFKDTAQQLSVVKATMENVSKGMAEYSENMDFIKKISKEYGQDMISLANGFAKFHAAANTSNLSLEQQRDIFKSLTRAAGAYHLSAEQTSNVMLAVEQMLSKGKITAEELRRQLGNSLPGAFNIMAKAAGVSTAELDSLMKAGKVISEEVLPKFANELDIITTVANFDSLQSSLNRFKNSWAEFVDQSGFENIFKRFVDFGTKSLDTLSNNFRGFISIFAGGLAGIATGKAFNHWSKEGENAILELTKQTNQFKGTLKNIDKQIDDLTVNGRKLANTKFHLVQPKELTKSKALLAGITEEEWKAAKWADEALRTKSFIIDRERELKINTNKLNSLEAQKLALIQEQIKAQETIEKSSTTLGKIGLGIKGVAKSILDSVKSIGVGLAAGAIVSTLASIGIYLAQIYKENKRIKNLVDDTIESVENRALKAYDEQVAKMNEHLNLIKNVNSTEAQRQKSLSVINRLLGDENLTIDDIRSNSDKVTVALSKWKGKILESARAAAYWDEIVTQQKKVIGLQRDYDELTGSTDYKNAKNAYNGPYSFPSYSDNIILNRARKLNDELDKTNKLISYYENKISEGQKGENSYLWGDPNEGPSEQDAIDDIRGALDRYKESLDGLKGKLKDGSISTKKYNRDVNKLREDTLKTIQKYDNWEDVVESLGNEYERLSGSLEQTSTYTTKTPVNELKEDLEKFKKEKDKLDNTLAAGRMTGDEYADSLEKLVNRVKDNVFGFEDLEGKLNGLGQKYKDIVAELNEAITNIDLWNEIDNAIKEQDKQLEKEFNESIEKLQKYYDKSAEIMADGIPKKRQRETSLFAYKDGVDSVLAGHAKDAEDYVKELERVRNKILELKKLNGLDPYMQKMLDDVVAKLKVARAEASSLKDASFFWELNEDIKKLQNELASDMWESWADGVVGAAGRINSALQTINESFDGDLFDEEFLEGVGKALKVLDSLNVIVETVNGTFKTFNAIMETTTKLQQAQAAVTSVLTGAKMQGLAAETAAEGTSAAATVSAEASKQAAIQATTAAYVGEAAAGAASSLSWIAVVGPALGMAAAGAMVAFLMSQMNKFATGGIVGGSKTQGDQNVIRANSGEMVLNKAQQGNLFNLIKNGGGLGGNVEFVLRGDRLVGAIQNYQSRIRG